MKRTNALIAWSAIGLAMLSFSVSCKKESEKSPVPYYNAKHITDENKVAMLPLSKIWMAQDACSRSITM